MLWVLEDLENHTTVSVCTSFSVSCCGCWSIWQQWPPNLRRHRTRGTSRLSTERPLGVHCRGWGIPWTMPTHTRSGSLLKRWPARLDSHVQCVSEMWSTTGGQEWTSNCRFPRGAKFLRRRPNFPPAPLKETQVWIRKWLRITIY